MVDPATCQSLLLFGGAFDPPHIAHVRLAELARQGLQLEATTFIPAAVSPLKDTLLSAPEHRAAMLQLALADEPHATLLLDELDRTQNDEPSYTIDTLTALRKRLGPNVHFRLLIGADQLRQFDRWRDWREVIDLAEPAVMMRPQCCEEELEIILPSDFERTEWAPRVTALPLMPISSTDIRQKVREGVSIEGLVHPDVDAYIQTHRLYCSETNGET